MVSPKHLAQDRRVSYPESWIRECISTSSDFEDVMSQVIEIVVGIWIIEAFGKSVNEDAGVRRLDLDLRIGAVVVIDGQEQIASGCFSLSGRRAQRVSELAIVSDDMVAKNRMNLDSAEESASSLDNSEKEECSRDRDGRVNPVLNAGEHSHNHTRKEDDDFEWIDSPKLVDRIWRCDEVPNSVDDDGGK
jgi:hypothetical protein